MLKKIFIFCLAFLVLPSFVFGAVSYSRTPSGFTIQNPVSIDFSADDFSDFCVEEGANAWGLNFTGFEGADVYGDCYSSTTLSISEGFNLPVEVYGAVYANCFDTFENCEGYPEDPEGWLDASYLEWDDGDPIFEVVEGGPEGGIVTLTSDFPLGILGLIGELFSGIKLLIAVVIGLPLAFWGIKKVTALIRVEK